MVQITSLANVHYYISGQIKINDCDYQLCKCMTACNPFLSFFILVLKFYGEIDYSNLKFGRKISKI